MMYNSIITDYLIHFLSLHGRFGAMQKQKEDMQYGYQAGNSF